MALTGLILGIFKAGVGQIYGRFGQVQDKFMIDFGWVEDKLLIGQEPF